MDVKTQPARTLSNFAFEPGDATRYHLHCLKIEEPKDLRTLGFGEDSEVIMFTFGVATRPMRSVFLANGKNSFLSFSYFLSKISGTHVSKHTAEDVMFYAVAVYILGRPEDEYFTDPLFEKLGTDFLSSRLGDDPMGVW